MVMLREKAQSVEHLGRNTNAPSRGGLVRSSNEVPVMGMERRDKRNAGQAGQQSGNTLEELGGKQCIPKSRVRWRVSSTVP